MRRVNERLSDSVRKRTRIVFDASNPPRDRPNRFEVDGLQVWFAVGYAEADDLLEEIISKHSAPKQLAVVSSDRRVQVAASRRGATPFESDHWLDELLDGRCLLAPSQRSKAESAGQGRGEETKPLPSEDEIDDWMGEFGF